MRSDDIIKQVEGNMERSKVYFTDFRTTLGVSLTAKLQKLIRMAGIGTIDMDGKFVAIKMHFGELGNLAYLRPNYAKAVADVVKEGNGMPFLTDCNTLIITQPLFQTGILIAYCTFIRGVRRSFISFNRLL